MTDKQIMKMVAVSGCEYYFDEKCRCMDASIMQDFYSCPQCSSNPNCYYKQLKRKEQECKALREDIKDIANLLDLDTGEEYNFGNIELEIKQLKVKEQEYEELRKYHNKCCEENANKEAEWLEKFNQVSIGFYNGDYCNTEHCSLLKAKEQECEELKNIINEAKNSKLDLKSFLVGEAVQNEYEQQLNQFKAINEELKKTIDDLLHKPEIQDKILWKIDNEKLLLSKDTYIYKLEKTLQEIKGIAEENIRIADLEGLNGVYRRGLAKQILQKISESEGR